MPGTLLIVAVVVLISVNVIHPTERLTIGFAILLPRRLPCRLARRLGVC